MRLILALVLFFAVGATAQTNALSDAEIQGRQLAQQLCEAKPEQNFTNSGIMKIRIKAKIQPDLSLQVETVAKPESWQVSYTVLSFNDGTNDWITRGKTLKIEHSLWLPSHYEITDWSEHGIKSNGVPMTNFEVDKNHNVKSTTTISSSTSAVSEVDFFTSFANSDFWLCDLGLEFFHWPQQKVLPKSTNLKRGRDYTLLESTNPNPAKNGYSRVLSWIDKETGGLLQAEAYDTQGKLLKVFEPKSSGKDNNGQWQVEEIQIRNVQTDSRTRLEFDLKP